MCQVHQESPRPHRCSVRKWWTWLSWVSPIFGSAQACILGSLVEWIKLTFTYASVTPGAWDFPEDYTFGERFQNHESTITKNASMFHPPNTIRKEPESSMEAVGVFPLWGQEWSIGLWWLWEGAGSSAPTDGFQKVPLFSMACVMIPVLRVFGVPMNHWIGLRENL